MLSKGLKDKTEIVIRHDVLKNGFCGNESNSKRDLSLPDLMNVLKTFRDEVSALVYCQGNRTADIFNFLQELRISNSIQVFSIVKEYIYLRKHKNLDLLKQPKALRLSPQIGVENIDFILRKNVIIPQIPLKDDRSVIVSLAGSLKKRPPLRHLP